MQSNKLSFATAAYKKTQNKEQQAKNLQNPPTQKKETLRNPNLTLSPYVRKEKRNTSFFNFKAS